MRITEQFSKRKIVIGVSVGSLLESYDFALFAYFIPILTPLFFPKDTPFVAVLYFMGIYSSSYLMRPLSSFFFGYFGDTVGRNRMLILSILLMAFPTLFIGILPTRDQVGAWAPSLLLFTRLLQGFALGGELSGATVYLAEEAPKEHRGLYCSWPFFAATLGLIFGTGSIAFLDRYLTQDQLFMWGWRIPFLSGIFLAIVGFYLRKNIPETQMFEKLKRENLLLDNPLKTTFTQYWRTLLLGLGLIAGTAALVGMNFMYLSTFLVTFVGLPLKNSLFLNTFISIILAIFIPLMAHLSDRIGRKYVLTWGYIALLIITVPFYHLIRFGHPIILLFVLFFFGLFSACILGLSGVVLAELYPTPIRYSGFSVSYNIGFGIFAGLVPFVALFLIHLTGHIYAPSWFIIGCLILSLLCVLKLKEMANRSLPE